MTDDGLLTLGGSKSSPLLVGVAPVPYFGRPQAVFFANDFETYELERRRLWQSRQAKSLSIEQDLDDPTDVGNVAAMEPTQRRCALAAARAHFLEARSQRLAASSDVAPAHSVALSVP